MTRLPGSRAHLRSNLCQCLSDARHEPPSSCRVRAGVVSPRQNNPQTRNKAMMANGALGTGISAHKRANDLSDFAEELDMIEALGVEAIELPTYDMDIVVGGKIRQPQMK